MEFQDQAERKSSFNPEAVAFSPTAAEQAARSAAAARTIDPIPLQARVSVLPRRKYDGPHGGNFVEKKTEDSPLRPRDMRRARAHIRASGLAPVPMRLEEFLSRGQPLDLVAQTPGGE
jgi:hypothetical protein